IAFVLQALSVVLTITASDYDSMWYACIIAGLGHGVVEACINPLCASIYRDEKSKMLNILHASWPAGIVMGGIVYLGLYQSDAETWATSQTMFWFMLLPVIAYAVLFCMCKKFPIDERIEQNVSMFEMLKEFGGLGAFLALTFLFYEASSQSELCASVVSFFDNRLLACAVLGAVGGALFGFLVGSQGKWIFFFLCLIMIPLATAEIATDGWIKKLMEPTLGQYAAWALVLSASIMMILRFFAGIPLRHMSPVALLLLSSVFSIIGLFFLSYASGIWIFLAFVIYAIGQTFYWPTVLGFVSEQFPKGGAMSLNTVSAMGLLTVGIFGFPFLGAVQDHYNAQAIMKHQPALVETIKNEQRVHADTVIYVDQKLFGVSYVSINKGGIFAQGLSQQDEDILSEELKGTGRSTLRVAAILPIIMAISFLLMLLYYRSQGGYKAVHLSEEKLD
ncbi:MAG: MFS transporter, partial [Planctomycetes bacterium]|nr:MFS transporter [Planctomycetota bacterium]